MKNNNLSIQFIDAQKLYKAIDPNITTNKGGIQFWNSSSNEEDNAMPYKLADLAKKSSIHRNFLNLKASLIGSTGLYPVDDNNTNLAQFLNTKNRHGDTVQKVWKKAAKDLGVFEQTFLEVIYDGTGKVAEMYHVPFNTIRAGEENENGIIENYYHSNTWGLVTNVKTKKKRNDTSTATPIPSFDPDNIGEGRQIMHLKLDDILSSTYSEPSYLSAEYWINVVHEVSQYVLNKFTNGYLLDGIIYIPSNLTPELQQEFTDAFAKKYKGSTGQKRMLVFGDTTISKPEFVPIQDALSNDIFTSYMHEAAKNIVFAHGGSLELIGLAVNDTLGTQSADLNAINVSRSKYIIDVLKPYQETMLDGFNRLFEINGLGSATVLNESLKLTVPVLQPTDTSVDERREIVLGLNPMVSPSGSTPTNNFIPNKAA